MNTFTASNGMTVRNIFRGVVRVQGSFPEWLDVQGAAAEALREFFRAEEDERLGRWRWPEHPEYVVYHPGATRQVRVLSELSGYFSTHDEESSEDPELYGGGARVFAEAARAYFDAHPEPKPWHKAEPGQVWLVNGKVRAVVERAREPHTFADPFYREMGIPVTDPSIVDARRITWEPTS